MKDAQSTFGSSGNSSNGLSTFSETGLTFSTSCNWKNTRIENNTRARHWMLERKKKGKKRRAVDKRPGLDVARNVIRERENY